MASFEHKKLVEQIAALDSPPSDKEEFAEWVKASAHLDFLEANARSDELIVYGSGEYSFIHAIAVPDELLEDPDQDDLLNWNSNPYGYAASYVSGGGREGIWIERGDRGGLGSKIIAEGKQLVFGRTFDGWTGEGRDYFEPLQEFVHLEDLRWRSEHRSYCRFDGNGDLDEAVSITMRDNNNVALVSFKRGPLETYLAASNQRLVQLFDFTLCDRRNFSSWGNAPEQVIQRSDELFYRQKVAGPAAYTRGVQIVQLSGSKADILSAKQESWFGGDRNRFAEFIAYDWRNAVLARISTDPADTTNYFEAKHNELPFELSPAFFKPEVLLKYKTDREKYKVGERDIYCRAAWHLRGFDVNEAGQVHAYICDLARLPYSEQLHWQSYNEEPKAPISRRAVENDFQGQFTTFVDPLGQIKRKVLQWNDEDIPWWRRRDQQTLDNATVPHSSSRDEWAESFMDLTKLVTEGFVVKPIREALQERGIVFDRQEGSLSLLEKLLTDVSGSDERYRLQGLRTAQDIRTKVKGHTSGSEAKQMAQEALKQHESFAKHFRHVCEQVHDEMSAIEEAFSVL